MCALTPSILSTAGGRDFVFYLIGKATSYQVEAKEVKLSWMGAQIISDLNVKDHLGRVSFDVHQIQTPSSLWKIIFYRDMGKLFIKAPSIYLTSSCDLPKQLSSQEMGFKLPFTLQPKFQPLGEIEMVEGKVSYALSSEHKVKAQDISLSALLLPHQFKAQIEGRMSSGEGTFQLQLFSYPKISQFDLTGKAQGISLSTLSYLNSLLNLEEQKILKEGLTETYSLEMKAKYYGERLDLELQANSLHTLLSLQGTVVNQLFSLTAPALIHYHIPASSAQKWTQMDIKAPLQGEITLNQFVLPLSQMDRFSFQGILKSHPIEWKEFTFDPFSLYLEKDQTDCAEWMVKIDSSQVQLNGKASLKQNWQDVCFQGQALLPKNTRIDMTCDTLKQIHIAADGDLMTVDLMGSLDLESKTFELLEEGVIDLHGLKYIPGFEEKFSECAPFHLKIEPCYVNFHHSSGKVAAQLNNQSFVCKEFIGKETNFSFHLDLYKKMIAVLGHSIVNQHPFHFEGAFSWLNGIEFQSSCEKAPLGFLHTLCNTPLSYRSLLGNELSFQLTGQLLGDESLGEVKITTPSLSTSMTFIGDQKLMTLKEPAYLKLHLESDEEQELPFLSDHQLILPFTLNMKMETLTFPLKIQGINEWLKQLDYTSSLEVSDLMIKDGLTLQTIPAFRLDLTQHAFFHQLSFTAFMQELRKQEPSLICQMQISPFQECKIDLQCHQFLTPLLNLARDQLAHIPLQKLLGQTFDLTLSTHLNHGTGPCELTLKSLVSQMDCSGFFHQGILNLKEPLYLQTHLFPEWSQWLIHRYYPNLNFSCLSQGPIQIEIAPEGFALPCFPWDLSRIEVTKGVCELGQLICDPFAPLDTLLSLLRTKRSKLNLSVPLWFAPIGWSFHQGHLAISRMDVLLAEEFPLCFTGKCDFTHQTVDGMIGLTAVAIQKIFQVAKLPPNYILPIPLTGTLEAVEIHPKQAMHSIGQLILWKQSSKLSKKAKDLAEEGGNEFARKRGSAETSELFPPLKELLPWELQDIKEYEDLEKEEARKLEQTYINPKDPPLQQALKYFH
ncbi:MAG: hypothetical protein QRY72_00005 [Candidatus Rhabdochlamydia sp.]